MASLVRSSDLRVLIEAIDDQAHVDKLIAILDEMVRGALVIERVRVVSYAAGAEGIWARWEVQDSARIYGVRPRRFCSGSGQ